MTRRGDRDSYGIISFSVCHTELLNFNLFYLQEKFSNLEYYPLAFLCTPESDFPRMRFIFFIKHPGCLVSTSQ